MMPTEAEIRAGRRRVVIVRHGDVRYFDEAGTPLDPRSVPLTTRGVEQAQAAGRLLATTPLDLALVSPMPRARQTLAEILRVREPGPSVPTETVDSLRELKAGRFRDVPAAQFFAAVGELYVDAATPGAAFAGGERFDALQARVGAVWQALLAREDWRTVLIVAHDAVNRMLIATALGWGLAALDGLEQDLGGVSLVDVDPPPSRRALLRRLNITPLDPVRQDDPLTSMERVALSYHGG